MFVAILHRIDGENEEGECKFEDVPSGAYYEKAVAWASTNGIVAGISATEFDPNAENKWQRFCTDTQITRR